MVFIFQLDMIFMVKGRERMIFMVKWREREREREKEREIDGRINVMLLRLPPRQWPKFDRGAAK